MSLELLTGAGGILSASGGVIMETALHRERVVIEGIVAAVVTAGLYILGEIPDTLTAMIVWGELVNVLSLGVDLVGSGNKKFVTFGLAAGLGVAGFLLEGQNFDMRRMFPGGGDFEWWRWAFGQAGNLQMPDVPNIR